MEFFIMPNKEWSKKFANMLNLRDDFTVGYIPLEEGEATRNAMTSHLIRTRLAKAFDIAIDESLVTPFIISLLKQYNMRRIHLITGNGVSEVANQLKEFIPTVEITSLASWGINSIVNPVAPQPEPTSAPMSLSEIESEIVKIIFQKGEELKKVPINFDNIKALHAKQERLEAMKADLILRTTEKVASSNIFDGEYHFKGDQILK